MINTTCGVLICRRRSCAFYNTDLSNNCKALSDVYEDNTKCKFYKAKGLICPDGTEWRKENW